MHGDGQETILPPGAVESGSSAEQTRIWNRAEEIVDRAPTVQSLAAHRLHLMAARVWRARGRDIPTVLAAEERRNAMVTIAARPLLKRARAAYGGKLLLMKGAEVAAHYRHPADRPFRDLDLLAEDAPAAQRALVQAGFVQCGDPAGYEHQHLCPLVWPGVPLFIEIHRWPTSPAWARRAPIDDILNLAVPSATGVEGLLAPDPAVHALLVVAHCWAEAPLGRLGDLIDVAALVTGEGRRRAEGLAGRWGWHGMWRLATQAADAAFGDRGWPTSVRLWARHLAAARDRTVFENHIARIAAPASALPFFDASVAMANAIKKTAAPCEGEPWSDKLRRSGLAVAHAFTATSLHSRSVSERRLQ